LESRKETKKTLNTWFLFNAKSIQRFRFLP
jgi:hypothetical protein